MDTHCSYISYKETGYFARIVTDYIEQSPNLDSFYAFPPTREGILSAINQRNGFPVSRPALTEVLKEQYVKMDLTVSVMRNIDALAQDSTYTITTAHQPNIFTGPLYFIFKIAHAIRLARYCKQEFPQFEFVPVYYMGSEDADLEELGHVTIDGTLYKWQTTQTGAVGRMKVDKAFIELLNDIEGSLGILPHGPELIALFRRHYTIHKTIQQATLEIVNELFGAYGLLVLIPDHVELKRQFVSLAARELQETFSHLAVEHTLTRLSSSYKVQATGRQVNLFYLTNGRRERIEKKKDKYFVLNADVVFSESEILQELSDHPERFSPNVILRGVFQELILPNIIFIGGGSELAYWMELKDVFQKANVAYPVLVLRNSFMLLREDVKKKWDNLGFTLPELFKSGQDLMKQLVIRASDNKILLNGELTSLEELYEVIRAMAGKVDATLSEHVASLRKQSVKRLKELEKKILRSEKKKFEAEERQVQKIKSLLFPDGLQERKENFSGWYASFGKDFIGEIIEHSLALEQQFTFLQIEA